MVAYPQGSPIRPRDMVSPRIAFLVVMAIMLVMRTFISRVTHINAVGNIVDGTIVLVSLIHIAVSLRRAAIRPLLFVWLTALVVFTTLSMLGHFSRGLFVAMASSFLFAKIFLFISVTETFDFRVLRRVMPILVIIHLIGIAAQLAMPGYFEQLLPNVSYTIDSSRVSGFLLNANRAGALSSILALYYWFVRRRPAVALMFFALLMFSTSRSFAIFTLLAFSYFHILSTGSVGKVLLLPLVAGAALVISTFAKFGTTTEAISATLAGGGYYIRAGMLLGGLKMAADFFPFGSGGGTFGSSMSAGSPAYDYVGIASWNSVVDMSGVFDNGFGALFGEYGALGMVSAAILLYFMFRYRGAGILKRIDILFLVGTTLFLSLFRTVIADFFYSAYILLIMLILLVIRQRAPRRVHSALRKVSGRLAMVSNGTT